MAYMILAEKAASFHRPLWPLKPKVHVAKMQQDKSVFMLLYEMSAMIWSMLGKLRHGKRLHGIN